MKKTNIALLCTSLAFSGSLFAGWADLLNQATETADQVQNTSTAIDTLNTAVPKKPALTQEASQTGLVDTLVQQLGVSSEQAEGGSGALFQMAKGNMSGSDFNQVSQSVPEMDGLLAAAPQAQPASETGSLLSGLAAASGNSSLINAASLADTFKQLNLSEGMVSQFTPVVLDYVKKNGGEVASNLLKAALTGQ